MKKISILLQCVIWALALQLYTIPKVYGAVSLAPVFSHEAGFYNEGFALSMSAQPGTDIYYTMDSSEPNQHSQIYETPLWIDESWILATGEEVVIAPDQEGHVPDPAYPISMIRTTSLYWISPKEDIFKATVVKAIAIDRQTGEQSEIITHTYFVHPLMDDFYDFSIISLSTDIKNLYDYDEGINIPGVYYDQNVEEKGIQEAFQDNYGSLTHPGQNRTGNYFQKGDAWEKPVFVEYFTREGDRVIAQHAGLRLHGGLSRKYTIKSYRLYADDKYDSEDTFNYPFFSDKAINEYKRIILRNGGQTYQYTLMGEALAQSILKPLALDMQYSTPVILFINGEYFGIRNIRDRLDQYYLSSHYQLDPDDVTILTGHAFIDEGSILDQAHYQRMYSYASTKDLSIQKHYQKMTTWMDMDNFIDYMIAELFVGNVDWPQNNITYWRKSGGYYPSAPYGHDGRWRWMIQDLDASFGASWGTTDASFNGFTRLTGDSWKTGKLFVRLLQNPQFKAKFIYRIEALLHTVYDSERVSDIVQSMIDLYAPEMPDHIARFGYPVSIDTWHSYTSRMLDFALERPEIFQQQMLDWFDLNQKHTITVRYEADHGNVIINHNLDTDGFNSQTFYEGLPVTMQAIPEDGYHFVGWYEEDVKLSDHETIYFPPYDEANIYALFDIGEAPQDRTSSPLGWQIATSIVTLLNITALSYIIIKHKKSSSSIL